jgi:RimJ/RimL family protein N-acetyltransferase
MPSIRLRAVRESDVPSLAQQPADDDPFGFFGFTATNGLTRRFAETGMLTPDLGTLAVEDEAGNLLGTVGWKATQHGPSPTARALNVGILLQPHARGRGYGTEAQRRLAEYLFETTLVERLEAGTDVDNVAEQRALEKAGFSREGVMRHAQFRAGSWHDIVLYSRLRGDRPAS